MWRLVEPRVIVRQPIEPAGGGAENDLLRSARTERLGMRDPCRTIGNMASCIVPLGPADPLHEIAAHDDVHRGFVMAMGRHCAAGPVTGNPQTGLGEQG